LKKIQGFHVKIIKGKSRNGQITEYGFFLLGDLLKDEKL